jgi:hypothetical protein
MSALGQKRTFSEIWAMSALPPKADIAGRQFDVCFVPIADIQLNGEVLKRSAGDELPTLKPIHLSAGPVELQPASISFLAVLKAGNPSCRQR